MDLVDVVPRVGVPVVFAVLGVRKLVAARQAVVDRNGEPLALRGWSYVAVAVTLVLVTIGKAAGHAFGWPGNLVGWSLAAGPAVVAVWADRKARRSARGHALGGAGGQELHPGGGQ